MIGRRLVLAALAVATAFGLALALGPGGPRPELEAAARRIIVDAADRADAALTELVTALEPAVDAGRVGSARAVAGVEAPGPKLAEAATLAREAEDAAAGAGSTLVALDRARRAADPSVQPMQPVVVAGELESIAGQLEAAADAADDFAAMRGRAASVLTELDAAIVALDGGDLEAARDHVGRARDDHTAIADWDVGLVTLPVWVETTGAMIGAVERIITATQNGDADAAERAAAEFAAHGEDAAPADRALRIAISEGGSAIAAVPLGRLAAILAAATDAHATIAAVRESATP